MKNSTLFYIVVCFVSFCTLMYLVPVLMLVAFIVTFIVSFFFCCMDITMSKSYSEEVSKLNYVSIILNSIKKFMKYIDSKEPIIKSNKPKKFECYEFDRGNNPYNSCKTQCQDCKSHEILDDYQKAKSKYFKT